ncbi:MAG: hypothetical protein H0V36_08415 [Chloroflexi bacterium]|nr:hypothetical protein [Chloroflexota bacterium]
MTPGTAVGDHLARSHPRRGSLERIDPLWVAGGLVLIAAVVYLLSHPDRANFYNHFVWQADAWLHGRVAITYPTVGAFRNDYFQDVFPLVDKPGFALVPFPPLPALILSPFVAVFGLATNAALIAALLGAINVGLCWRMVRRLTSRPGTALLATCFYGFGTVAWYAAMLGSTWFLAHVVASTFLFLAITAALDADRRTRSGSTEQTPGKWPVLDWISGHQFVAGLLFGMAALARLTTIFGAPFFLLVGGGGWWFRRAFSAGLGAAIPIALLLAYNLATTGHFFHPAYEYLYRNEYRPRPDLYRAEWAIEDPRYLPQNAAIMFLWPPHESPERQRLQCDGDPTTGPVGGPEYPPASGIGLLLDEHCAVIRPDPIGMSVLLASPGYLLALPALRRLGRRRLVAGAAIAVAAIALINLMHFSQGWVQFGYRFSNDFAPFALIPLTLGIARLGVRPLTVALVALSVAINAWGVYWGVTLGW